MPLWFIIMGSNETTKGNHKVFYSTGRGGAGNIKASSTKPRPNMISQGSGTPKLHTDKVSTGRGGYGNMLKNDDPNLTRRVQDVDNPSSQKENELYAVQSNKSFSVGRGGFGNVVTNDSSLKSIHSDENSPNLMAVTSNEKYKQQKKGFFLKLKQKIFGD